MKLRKSNLVLTSLSALALGTVSSQALIVMISDTSPGGSPIESFFTTNFGNVTEIRHGNFGNYAATASQDALNGTGVYAGSGAADIFVVGRSLSSGDYDDGASDGYNALTIPFINFTSFTARDSGNRLGWHTGDVSTGQSRSGAETTVTVAGAAMLGIGVGTHDIFTDVGNVRALGVGTGVGTGDVLASVGGDLLAAHWDAGDAPGNTTAAGVATFPGTRLLFNLDNEPNVGNDGTNDFTTLTATGSTALITAIDNATDLNAIPEPSTSLFSLVTALGLVLHRRR